MEDRNNMEEKKEEMDTGEVEMSQQMAKRIHWIDIHTNWYLMQLLELDVDTAEERFPWNKEILRKVFVSTVSILKEYGYAVCTPCITSMGSGRQYRCMLSECGCGSCGCQDGFMEKERILSNIEDTAARNGLKVVGCGEDRVIVREGSTDTDYEVRVSRLAG